MHEAQFVVRYSSQKLLNQSMYVLLNGCLDTIQNQK